MKRYRFIGMVILISAWLSGCWDRVEINDLAVVTATGLDRGPDGDIKVTVQIFTPQVGQSGGGSGASQSGGGTPTVFTEKGKDVSDALDRLQHKVARRIYGGHNETLIIGRELAKTDVRGYLDYIQRIPVSRGTTSIYISETTAEEIMSLQPALRRSVSEALENFKMLHIGWHISAGTFINELTSDINTAVLPVLAPGSMNEGSSNQIQINKLAVFQDGKVIGYLNESESKGMVWLRNETHPGFQNTVELESAGLITALLTRSQVKLTPSYNQGRWEMKVKGKMKYNLQENTTNIDVSMSPEQTRKLEQQIRLQIENDMQAALSRAQEELKADIFEFYEHFRIRMPERYRQHKEHWNEEIFPNIKVTYDLQVQLIDPGKRTLPTAWPPNEVKR